MALYKALSKTLYRRLCRCLCKCLYRRSCGFVGIFIGARSGSIVNGIYRVEDEFSNGGIGELSSTILGIKVRY